MLVHHRVTPQHWICHYPFVHLVERGTVRVKCLALGQNVRSPPGHRNSTHVHLSTIYLTSLATSHFLPSLYRCRSRILKWGVSFYNNVIEPINIWGKRKKREEAQKKGGENSPISPPLDPRLLYRLWDKSKAYWLVTSRKKILALLIWVILLSHAQWCVRDLQIIIILWELFSLFNSSNFCKYC